MPRRWTIGFLLLCCLWAIVSCGSQDGGSQAHVPELATAEIQASAPALDERVLSGPTRGVERPAPHKAYDLLEKLRQRDGTPLLGYVGGREFQNREQRLPRGRYREYDVNRKIPGQSRDAERIVIEQKTGKAYYSSDHYGTFIPLN